jgi:glycine dehydrogenase subunit 1
MRYLPLTPADRTAMLATIGARTVDDLFQDVPAKARLTAPLDLPDHQGELEVERAIGALAARNVPIGSAMSFLGSGAYRHHVPAAVDAIIQRGEFLTSYTPYQPEISQGTLQYLFEFQTQVAMLTAMDVANASMYDGATACAEAVLMARRVTRKAKVVLSGNLHPHWRDTVATFTQYTDAKLDIGPPTPVGEEDLASHIDADTACVVAQNPDAFGRIRDLSGLAERCHAAGALLIVAVAEIVSLGLIKPPGEMGADIVVAEGQSIGNGLNFGGPYLGLFATREKFVRQMPGRLCGETVDADGKRGFVLTLSTREQHIRREKATSNICTNSGLCALAFTVHMALLGSEGLARLARINHHNATMLAYRLNQITGIEVVNDTFFNEFTVKLAKPAAKVVERLASRNIFAGVPASRLWPGVAGLDNHLVLAVTETSNKDEMMTFAGAMVEAIR